VLSLEESTTYQAILAKGETQGALREARKILLLQGEILFGPPDRSTRQALDGIAQLEHLEALGVRLLQVESWKELLQESGAASSQPRRRRRNNPEAP
jgi:hypothetical protein